jgi:integrase
MTQMLLETTWEEAFRGYILHSKATWEPKTVEFHYTHVSQLMRWSIAKEITLEGFGKRHLDEYKLYRQSLGRSVNTVSHDMRNALLFFKWCKHNELIERNNLADCKVRRLPRKAQPRPTDDDMTRFLEVTLEYWDTKKNPVVRHVSPKRRNFHRDRNRALILLLLDSSARINEVLSLKMDDYLREAQKFQLTKTKNKEERKVPLSPEGVEMLEQWLQVRRRIMRNVPPDQDPGYIFISENGDRMNNGTFSQSINRYSDFAGIPRIRCHDFRRFSLHRLAKKNPMAAQQIAGHKDISTTMIYTETDEEFKKEIHEEAGVLRNLLGTKRADKEKRKRLQFA